MKFLSKFFSRPQVSQASSNENKQAVIVRFEYLGGTNLSRLFELEDELKAAISKNGVGEYDGNEVATNGSSSTLYMYGLNADRLFEVVAPILKNCETIQGVKATVRYGPPADGVKEKIIEL